MVGFPPIFWPAVAGGAVCLVNGLAFLMFGLDKRRARTGAWRISESTLLGIALIGGWFGAKLGQRVFRHKTRKEPFRTRLNRIPGLWVLGAAAWWVARP